jgi:hypothetical protein
VYLINFLNLQAAQQLFVATARYRTGIDLQGTKNGSNVTYTIPLGDKFTHNLPFLTIQVYWNGQRLRLLDDYTIIESEGPGTGYDTVVVEEPPIPQDKLLVDYIASNAPP